MKVSEVITDRARLELNDNEPANVQRWGNALLLLFFNDASRLIVSQRPEELLDGNGALVTIVDRTGLGQDVQIAAKWVPAYVAYICSRAFKVPGQERMNLEAAAAQEDSFWRLIKNL